MHDGQYNTAASEIDPLGEEFFGRKPSTMQPEEAWTPEWTPTPLSTGQRIGMYATAAMAIACLCAWLLMTLLGDALVVTPATLGHSPNVPPSAVPDPPATIAQTRHSSDSE